MGEIPLDGIFLMIETRLWNCFKSSIYRRKLGMWLALWFQHRHDKNTVEIFLTGLRFKK